LNASFALFMLNRRGAKQYSRKAWRPQAKKHPPIASILRHHKGMEILAQERPTFSTVERLRTTVTQDIWGTNLVTYSLISANKERAPVSK
jgi:hypothetical protein